MTAISLAAVLAAAMVGGFVQGFAGFGSTLAALPIMTLALDAGAAVPAGCLMALCVNIVLVARLRAHIRTRALLGLVCASLPGAALGLVFMGAVPDAALKGLMGAATLYAAWKLSHAGPAVTAPGKGWAAVAGTAAGFLGVSIGINGPPIVAWTARQPWDAASVKATLTGYFFLTGLVIVGGQAANGLFTPTALTAFVWSLPALTLGLWAGLASCGRVGERVFRLAFLGLLAITGASLSAGAAATLIGL